MVLRNCSQNEAWFSSVSLELLCCRLFSAFSDNLRISNIPKTSMIVLLSVITLFKCDLFWQWITCQQRVTCLLYSIMTCRYSVVSVSKIDCESISAEGETHWVLKVAFFIHILTELIISWNAFMEWTLSKFHNPGKKRLNCTRTCDGMIVCGRHYNDEK